MLRRATWAVISVLLYGFGNPLRVGNDPQGQSFIASEPVEAPGTASQQAFRQAQGVRCSFADGVKSESAARETPFEPVNSAHAGTRQPCSFPKQLLVREDHGMRRFDERVDLSGRINHLAGADQIHK